MFIFGRRSASADVPDIIRMDATRAATLPRRRLYDYRL